MKQQRRSLSGSTMVEFALTLPLLALMLFGIIQYGFLFAAYITIRNASAVGARAYVVSQPPDSSVGVALARKALGPMLNENQPGLVITPNIVTGVSGGDAYSITVSYPVPL